MTWLGRTFRAKNPDIQDAVPHIHFVITDAEEEDVNRPGFDGGSVTRNMRTWREETVTHGKRIEVLARAS